MIDAYLAQDVIDECHEALSHGRTLDDLASLLRMDCEYLGRILQLPTAPAATTSQQDDYLWRADLLDAVL